MIDAPFCNAVSLLTGFTGWVLAVWSFLRPERDRSGWKLAGGGMACALALLAQLFAVQLETVAGDLKRPWSRPPAQLSPAGSCL
ncbi:MAG: hypothetical protein ACLTG0_08105 [Oscillibacter sp.]